MTKGSGKGGTSHGHGDNKGSKGNDKGGKGDNKGGKNKGPSGRYGEYAGYKGVSRKRASRMAQDEIRDVLQGLRRDVNKINRQASHDRDEVNREYRRTRADTDFAFGESDEQMRLQNGILTDRFNDAGSAQQAAQAALMAQLSQGAQQSLGGAADELSRLGLSGNFGDQAASDQMYAQQQAQLMGMNQMGQLGAMQMGSQSVGDMLLNMNAGSKANMLTQALQARNDARSGIRDDRNDARSDVRMQMQQAKSQKGAITREILQQLAQLGWAQYVDQKNLNQNQQQINMQRRQMGQDNARANAAQQQQAAYSGTLAQGLGQVLGNKRKP